MRTSTTHPGLGASAAAPRAVVPAAVPTQPVVAAAGAAPAPTTSLQRAARTPAALMGLGTQALATALVVRSCPPGHLRTALDALAEPGRN